jgi:hypothetical protein
VGIEIPNARYVDGVVDEKEFVFTLSAPVAFWRDLADLFKVCVEKKNRYLDLRLDLPRKPRSIGPRSTNNRIRGHCANIAEQLAGDGKKANLSEEEVYAAMKRMSVDEGYPTYLSIDGIEQPLPMHNASEEQALIVCKVINRFADVHNLWLMEYDDTVSPPISYRSLGGRTRQEMEAM